MRKRPDLLLRKKAKRRSPRRPLFQLTKFSMLESPELPRETDPKEETDPQEEEIDPQEEEIDPQEEEIDLQEEETDLPGEDQEEDKREEEEDQEDQHPPS
jgi:hypothetical protein